MNSAIEPIIFEEHAAALVEWQRRELYGQTLIYLDAHLDLQFIDEERMARLAATKSVEEFAALEKPDHLLPDGGYVFGLENFLYAASQLGIINHLIWVAPPHVDVSHSQHVLDHVQQMDGVTFDELTLFKKSDGGWYEGTLLGLEITICNLAHLPLIPAPAEYLIDIDADFFVALPQDRAWTGPATVYEVLQRSFATPILVTVSRSVGSGFMPLRYRYFADYLEALWLQRAEVAAHYARLFQFDRKLSNESNGELLAGLEAELESFPECPATHYLYARYNEGAIDHDAEATSLCPSYRYDPVRLASETANRYLPSAVPALDNLHQEFVESMSASPAEGFVALGLAYAERGVPQKALHCYRAYGKPHPHLALAIAGLLAGPSDRNLRQELLEVAAREDASATSAHLQLAELAIGDHDFARAKSHLEKAHTAAPAWMEPLKKLAWLHEQLNGSGSANPYAIQLSNQANTLKELSLAK